MKDIRLTTLKVENFKCHRNLVINFAGMDKAIYGDNATGKTSIYDALIWLLFSKDSAGNGEKNFEVKPLDGNGEVKDHQAITSVEAVLTVDGEVKTFKRTYREVWATRRGTGTPVYEGNTSDYFVDGVPCKKNAFDSAIKEMVSEDLFRMLTSVSHFAAGMKWQERRAVLFDMAGAMTDREIMAQEDRFAPLMDSLGKLSISDYKAKLMHQKKGLTGVRDDAPTRINECTKTIQDIEGMDFAGMRQELEALNSRKDSIRVQILQLDHSNAADAKRMEIREAQLELGKLDAENKTHRARQTAGTVDVDRLRFDLSAKWQRLDRAERVLEAEKQMVSGHEERIGRAREQWISTNDEAFTGGTCPSCGQALPPDRLRRAQESFEARKQRRLAEIEESAADLRSAKAQAEDRVKRQTEDIQQLKAEIIALEKEVYAAEQQTVVVEDLPHYAENAHSFREQIHRLNGELADIMADNSAVKSRLRMEQEKIQREIDALAERIGRESLLNYSRRRIEELKADAQNAAEALESIESMLYLMEEFTRFKAKYVEQSINDHFRIATFRLFREQANGGLEERCDAQHDGVPFLGLNNGMKVNVGIDIINALSRHYGVTVPLFVDNAEAVTRLEQCSAQVIRLVVSEDDKELRIV